VPSSTAGFFSIDAKDFRDAAGRFMKIDKEAFAAACRQHGDDLGSTVKTAMAQELEPIKYTGELAESIDYRVMAFADTVDITVGPESKAALFVRYGTAPHWVPIDPLLRWAAQKLGDAKAAYKVKWAIHEFGTSAYSYGLYGDKANDYPGRTAERADVKSATELFMDRVADEIGAAVTVKRAWA
jgi:hypothetical protein